jgi:hypothetical protein
MTYYTSNAQPKDFIKVYDADDQILSNSPFMSILLLVNVFADCYTPVHYPRMNFNVNDTTRILVLSLKKIISNTLPRHSIPIIDTSEHSVMKSTVWLYQHYFIKHELHQMVNTLTASIKDWIQENDPTEVNEETFCYSHFLSALIVNSPLFKIDAFVDFPRTELHPLLCTSITSASRYSNRDCQCSKPHLHQTSRTIIASLSLPDQIIALSHTLSSDSERTLRASFLCSVRQKPIGPREYMKFNELISSRKVKVKDFSLNACNPLHHDFTHETISRLTLSHVYLNVYMEQQEYNVHLPISEILYDNVDVDNLYVLLTAAGSTIMTVNAFTFFQELLRQCSVLVQSVSSLIHAPPELLTYHQILVRYIWQRSSITLTYDNRGNSIRTAALQYAPLWDILYPSSDTSSLGLAILSQSVPALNDITSMSVPKSVATVLHYARLTICKNKIDGFDALLDAFPLRTAFPFSCSGLTSSHFKNYLDGIPIDEFPLISRSSSIKYMQSMTWFEILISQTTPLIPPMIPPPTLRVEPLDKEDLDSIKERLPALRLLQTKCLDQLSDDLCLSKVATYGYVKPPTDVTDSSYLDDFECLIDDEN